MFRFCCKVGSRGGEFSHHTCPISFSEWAFRSANIIGTVILQKAVSLVGI